MILAKWPVSSILAIRMRTSSTIYKNYIEIREEWVNRDQRFLIAIKKVWRVG
jgi:hypothetical protein